MTNRIAFHPCTLRLELASNRIRHPELRSPRRPVAKNLRLLFNQVLLHQTWALVALGFSTVLLLTGCHSYHIDSTIENCTDTDIQLIEVDYPSASFGVDHLAAGAVYHYRFQVRGSGPLSLSYTTSHGRQVHITGPNLFEQQQGQLQIVLLPNAKTDFIPRLSPNP